MENQYLKKQKLQKQNKENICVWGNTLGRQGEIFSKSYQK